MQAVTRPQTDPRYSTLLALVWDLDREAASADEVAFMAARLVNEGRVVLTGNFRGCRLELDPSPAV